MASGLEADNRRLRVALRAIGDGVVSVDRGGRITHANAAALRLCGWTSEQVVGKAVDQVLRLHQQPDGPRVENPVVRTLMKGSPQVLPLGAWLPDGSGAACHVGITATPVRSSQGEVEGAVIVLRDLSERERLQGLLTRADRLSSMGTMAAAIAHEINNPLTHMLLNVEGVQEALTDLDAMDPHAIAAALEDVTLGARAIERIVHDLKLLSTSDQRSQEAVDVAAVLRRTQRMAAKTVRAQGRFEASLPRTQPVFANPVALGQVVTNLVLNAAQAFADGYSTDNLVRLSCADHGEEVVIEVQDNGVGIPLEDLDRIFDPFFTTKQVGEGTGLGLAISHQIVSDLGGRIEVESEIGLGSTFRVILPVTSQVPDDFDEPSLHADGSYPRRRVLVVDDDQQVRRAIHTTLRRDHDVEVLSSVDQALERIGAGFGYDAILCDLMMSPRTGLDLLDELQVVAPDLALRLAFITGGVFAGGLQEQVVRSGRPIAYKPFSRGQLMKLVEVLSLG